MINQLELTSKVLAFIVSIEFRSKQEKEIKIGDTFAIFEKDEVIYLYGFDVVKGKELLLAKGPLRINKDF